MLNSVYKSVTLLVLLLTFHSSLLAEPRDIKIGVIAYRGIDKAYAKWQPTVDYLQARLPEYRLTLIPLSLEQLRAAIIGEQLEFVFSNPGFYFVHKDYGLFPMTSQINKKQGKGYDQFGAIIFTRANRQDINTLEDVKGKSFGAVGKLAFGGFQMAWLEFVDQGIDPFTDFKPLKFTGFPQDAVVKAVERGELDVGTVRTDILERMQAAGEINMADFKVINQQQHENFPFLISTRLYPDYMLSHTNKAPLQLVNTITQLLTNMTSTSKAAIAGKYMGWTLHARLEHLLNMDLEQLMSIKIDDTDKFEGIDAMMKRLKIGPYQKNQ